MILAILTLIFIVSPTLFTLGASMAIAYRFKWWYVLLLLPFVVTLGFLVAIILVRIFA